FKTYLPLGLVVGGVMVLEIAFVLGNMYLGSGPSLSMPAEYNNTRELGIALYSEYSYAIQIGAMTLLVGMVAAIALTLRERRNRKYVTSDQQLGVKASDRLKMINIPSQTEVPTANEQGVKPVGEGQ
ncbi:MAG: NADH-quinone oxidoreductase subunit J family protein, partial [Advenella sp.]